jgi:hypothetical protein
MAEITNIEDGRRGPMSFEIEPLSFEKGTPPVFLELDQLRELEKSQARDFKLLAATMARARTEFRFANADLAGLPLAQRRRELKAAGTKKGQGIRNRMLERTRTAALTLEFYQPNAVRARAALKHPEGVASWVIRLNAAPAEALLTLAHFAVATRDIALSAMVLENARGKRADTMPEEVLRTITGHIDEWPLHEAIEGCQLVDSIRDAEVKAQCIMQVFEKNPLCFLDGEGFPNRVSDVPIEMDEPL